MHPGMGSSCQNIRDGVGCADIRYPTPKRLTGRAVELLRCLLLVGTQVAQLLCIERNFQGVGLSLWELRSAMVPHPLKSQAMYSGDTEVDSMVNAAGYPVKRL